MNKFKTYAFWLALSSAVVILVQSIGKLFGFEIESSTIENVIMSICGVLVVLGIVTKNTETNKGEDNTKECTNQNEIKNDIPEENNKEKNDTQQNI